PMIPLATYGNDIYYFTNNYEGKPLQLFRKVNGKSAEKISLTGNPLLHHSSVVVDHELYYVTVNNGVSELHVFNMEDRKSKKVSSLGALHFSTDSWYGSLVGVRYVNNELYVILHYGDYTMGNETLYKVVHDELKPITSAKLFIQYEILDGVL